mgnify:CR=1 FL=1
MILWREIIDTKVDTCNYEQKIMHTKLMKASHEISNIYVGDWKGQFMIEDLKI